MTTTSTTTGLADIVAQIAEKNRTRSAAHADHLRWMDEQAGAIARLEHQRDLLEGSSITVYQIDLARAVIEIGGTIGESAEGAFEAALVAVAEGGRDLMSQRIGAKRYDGFHQRCDCAYGMGPSHGHIVFSVGLTMVVRDRPARFVNAQPLSAVERDAATAYLLAEKRLSDELSRSKRGW